MVKLRTALLSLAEVLKFKKTNKMNDNKRKTLVEGVAQQMCKTENRISTRKLKLEMRNQYPTEMWNQYHDGKNKGVTEYFHELVHEGKFVSIANNGTYQTYASTSLPIISRKGDTYIPDAESDTKPAPKAATVTKLAKALGRSKPVVKSTKTLKPVVTKTVTKTLTVTKSISRTKAAELLTSTAGKFCSGRFIKKDSTERDMNFRVMKGTKPSALGYIQVVDVQLYNKARSAGKDKGEAQKASTRNINLQTLKMLRVNNVTNIVK